MVEQEGLPSPIDQAAQEYYDKKDWESLRRLIARRAQLHPELYPDSHSLQGFVDLSLPGNPAEAEEKAEEERRLRIRQVFFRGYTDEMFERKEVESRLRMVTNTSSFQQKRVFRSIMSYWGTIIQRLTFVQVDIDKSKLGFLEQPLSELIDQDECLLAYFTGHWITKGLPNTVTIKDSELASNMVQRLNKEHGLPILSLESDDHVLHIINRNRATIPRLKKTFADILPVDIMFPESKVKS